MEHYVIVVIVAFVAMHFLPIINIKEFVLCVNIMNNIHLVLRLVTSSADQLRGHKQQVSIHHPLIEVMLLLHHQDRNRRLQTELYARFAEV